MRCERLICSDCMTPASVGFQCPSCVKQGAATIRQPKAVYGGRSVAAPTVTFALIGLNVIMFLVTTGTGTGLAFGGNPSSVFNKLALIPATHQAHYAFPPSYGQGVAEGGYYRLLTATFLHYGIVHIALNMYCLFLLGPALESAFGRLRFLGIYLISGLSGSALTYLLGSPSEQAAGASGAIFGLFAAFFVVQRRRGGDVSQIALTIGINLFLSFGLSSFIDWRGHVGGLIGGALVSAALVYPPEGRRRWVLQAAGSVLVLVLVLVVVVVRTAALRSS